MLCFPLFQVREPFPWRLNFYCCTIWSILPNTYLAFYLIRSPTSPRIPIVTWQYGCKSGNPYIVFVSTYLTNNKRYKFFKNYLLNKDILWTQVLKPSLLSIEWTSLRKKYAISCKIIYTFVSKQYSCLQLLIFCWQKGIQCLELLICCRISI